MTIRKFEERDRDAARDVYLRTRRQCFTWLDGDCLELADFDADTVQEQLWVCSSAEKVVGFISVQAAARYIHHLFVLPQYANKGYGGQLLKACLAEVGYPAQLKCVAENTGALNFYKSQGWHTLSTAIGEDGEYHLMEVKKTKAMQ